jgi:hypothetical protein
MAARPPPADDDPEEPTAFGIATVDDYLEDADLEYPATRQDVVDALGDRSVRCGPNARELSLSAALERTGRRRFDSRRDLLDELHEVFEDERRGATGLVAWLKSLFGR